MNSLQESLNAKGAQILTAISQVDLELLRSLCHSDMNLQVPGPRDIDLSLQTQGIDEFCAWVSDVHRLCGATQFSIHRYFENGCELMASGAIHIQRLPRVFSSPCSLLFRFEAGKLVFLQLLLDTFALDKFRGEMD